MEMGQLGKLRAAPARKKPDPGRAYNSEKLEWNNDSVDVADDFGATPFDFYADFTDSVRDGVPLTITPESVRRNIALIEACKRMAPINQGQFALPVNV